MKGETIGNIGQKFNYDDVYLRMVIIALARTLNKSIRWINRFKDEDICVKVPMTYRMFGQERFLLDSFLDDITDSRVEMNTDMIPRGVISLTSFGSVSDEFANPNIYIPKETRIHKEYKKIITKVKAVPVSMNFQIEIKMANDRDIFVCAEKVMYLFFNYYFFSMNYYGIKIDLVLSLPDDKTIEMPTEGTFSDDKPFFLKFPLTVKGYYPIWTVDTDNVECYNEDFENIKRVYWENYIYDMKDLEGRVVPENIRDSTYQNSDPKDNMPDPLYPVI